jgi:hypothetical protein
MDHTNRQTIIKESEKKKISLEEISSSKLKVASATKKLKEDFFKDNEIKKAPEIFNDDFEATIDEKILQMEEAVGLVYESESDDGQSQTNGTRTKEFNSNYSSDDESDVLCAKNTQLIESSVLQRKMHEDQQKNSVMLPFYERRRLSECKEESESDEEVIELSKSVIVITALHSTSGAVPKKRFTVTKANEVDPPVKQPVSILKKTPSPPSNQKTFLTHSPKKIRYEASALKNVSAQKNSQTIHFPCTTNSIERENVRSFFSPQGFLNPHLDRRYFDSSLVEVRASQTLTDSSKSLDDRNIQPLDSNVWIKRNEKTSEDKISLSSDSVDKRSRVSGESVSFLRCIDFRGKSFLKMLQTLIFINFMGSQ